MLNKRILVIEDDHDVAEMLLMYFGTHQYEIFHAEDGSVGVDMARTHFPNVILLDVMLPYVDGYEVCRRIRSVALTKYIPIIFLTQRDQRADRVKGLELGADDYVTKPFDVEELGLRVKGSIRRATRSSLHEIRTGLPTGPLIDDEIARRENAGADFAQLWLSIEGFDAYNEAYGFMAADEVFGFAGRCIREVMSTGEHPDDFAGVVDNQFVVLTSRRSAQQVERHLRQRFEDGVSAFYNFVDAERGGVLLRPGMVDERFSPIMHFSITNGLS